MFEISTIINLIINQQPQRLLSIMLKNLLQIFENPTLVLAIGYSLIHFIN